MIKQSSEAYNQKFQLHDRGVIEDDLNLRVFPHGEFPVVVSKNGNRFAKFMNYSVVPPWSRDRKPKFATYNARVETICEKTTWKVPIKTKRCIVGLTSFFESCYKGSHAGNIVEFQSHDNDIWCAAGIHEEWVDKSSGEVIESFAIITTMPSKFIEETGHDRSPLFVSDDFVEQWVSDESIDCNQASKILLENHKPLEVANVKIERALKPGWEKRK